MMTDPRKACAAAEEHLGWAILHDAVAHPLMAASGYARWAVAFHDWTSHAAWPRSRMPGWFLGVRKTAAHGILIVREAQPEGFFSVTHGRLDRTVVVKEATWREAAARAETIFDYLEACA